MRQSPLDGDVYRHRRNNSQQHNGEADCGKTPGTSAHPAVVPQLSCRIAESARPAAEKRAAHRLILTLGLSVSPRTIRKYLPTLIPGAGLLLSYSPNTPADTKQITKQFEQRKADITIRRCSPGFRCPSLTNWVSSQSGKLLPT